MATARKLGRRVSRRKRPCGFYIPYLWFLTDQSRTPDPLAAVARLPRGAAVIYRTFGASDAKVIALRLRWLTHQRGVKLLIAADIALALAVRADDVHLPQRMMQLALRLRSAHPGWLITAAAHDNRAIIAGGRLGLDALLISPVFPSRSPSATRVLGPTRFAATTRLATVPVIALGGVNAETAKRLVGSRASGLAGVDAFAES